MSVTGKEIQSTIQKPKKLVNNLLQKVNFDQKMTQHYTKPKEVLHFKPMITDKAEIILLYADPKTEQRGKKRDQN